MTAPTGTSSFLLSKSSFLEGRQCPLRLWLRAAGVSEIPPGVTDYHNPVEDYLKQSREVEKLAQQLFTGGVDVSELAAEEDRLGVEQTWDLVQDPQIPSLFQAEFQTDHKIGIVDILERDNDGWILYEVKASNSIKPIFYWDLAFQWLLLEECGLRVTNAHVLLLNRQYTYPGGELDPHELLWREEGTPIVRALLPSVREEVHDQLTILNRDEAPTRQPSKHCRGNRGAKAADRPSDCGHLHSLCYCGNQLPDYWSFHLPRLSQNQQALLLDEKITHIEDLKADSLVAGWTDLQCRVIEAVQQDQVWIDESGLRTELSRLEWPLSFLDFEYDPGVAVPRFMGMRPYQRLPFQWSLQIQHQPDSPLEDVEPFLHDTIDDPREAFLESLLVALPETGSIVVHYQPAEWGVLNLYHEWFPGRYDAQLASMQRRFFDTCQVARDCYYHPAMQGSFSIKALAPALLGHGYEDLSIQDGMAAVRQWRQLIATEIDEMGRNAIRRDLLAYCHRDTELMFHILVELQRLVRRPK